MIQKNIADDLLQEKIFTVSEIAHAVKLTLKNKFPDEFKIQGEVSGIKKQASGHTYFKLKDEESVINAICWRGTKIDFDITDGMEIIVSGKIDSFPKNSQYQFIVKQANLAGEGALLKLLNDRRKKFEAMGYFAKKRPIPSFPRTIAIITSKTGAVLQDMRQRLEDRYPFCEVIVWPVNVQGTGAAEQIVEAIRGFNLYEKKPDIMIIARGGGSVEDLFVFNDEIIIRAVFESEIVVVSAIGHETDTTLIDFAADCRAPTPSAAIEMVTPDLSEIKNRIKTFEHRIKIAIGKEIKELQMKMTIVQKSLRSVEFYILQGAQKFDDSVGRMHNAIKTLIEQKRGIAGKNKIISLNNYVEIKIQRFRHIAKNIEKIIYKNIKDLEIKIANLARRLEQGSYKKILEKGFCFITTKSGKMISTKRDFTHRSEAVILHFQDGEQEM